VIEPGLFVILLKTRPPETFIEPVLLMLPLTVKETPAFIETAPPFERVKEEIV